MAKEVRQETDSIGDIDVPSNALWGAQTQRSLLNFSISDDLIPKQLIVSLAIIKQAAAITNCRLGVLSKDKCDLIIHASNEIAKGLHDSHFPLRVWQTGSGTHTNMNVNEVISNLASIRCGESLGSYIPLDPNDDVNRSQSTNDTFPAAIHIAVVKELTSQLLPEVKRLGDSFNKKSVEWKEIVKIGRTHLQDAVPLTLGQEASAWRDQIYSAQRRFEGVIKELLALPLGGTAIGTGLNAPKNYDIQIAEEISLLTSLKFKSSPNKFSVMASHDALVNAMSHLKLLSVSLLKIFNDIRLLSCGPRAGFGELILPANEPGSSIMPGKVNPTQCEAMAMVCTQIIGLDTAVSIAGSGGHLQMNSYKPLIAYNILHSIELLNNACKNCRELMVDGMQANRERIKTDLDKSLMLVTALTPKIGYKKACEIAQLAHNKSKTLREAAIELGYISQEDFDIIVNPHSMVNPN